jgi:hypothetical protein
MTLQTHAGMLHRRMVRRLGVLAVGGAGCAAVGALGGPGRIEHTRIVLQGSDPAAGVTVLMDALRPWWNLPGIDVVATPDGVLIDRQVPARSDETSPSGSVLAARAVEALDAAPAPAAAKEVAVPDRLTPELAAQRAGLEATRDEADRTAATLSTALSEVTRDIAAMQALDALPPSDAASAPMRKLLADLELHRIDLAARYAADYPGIAIVDTQIAGLKTLLSEAAKQRPLHPAAAALATLRAEQTRLQTDLDAETRLRDGLASRVAVLDGAIAQRLKAPPPPAAPTPDRLTAAIFTLAPADLPDRRPVWAAALAAATLVLAWLAGRRRSAAPAGLAARIGAIEQMAELPVLRCLDVDGAVIGGAGLLAVAGERATGLATRD